MQNIQPQVITTAQLHLTKLISGFEEVQIPAENKAKRLSSVNHTTKTIHHQGFMILLLEWSLYAVIGNDCNAYD